MSETAAKSEPGPDTITIPLAEYTRLVERSLWLSLLEEIGLDEYEGLTEDVQARYEELKWH